MDKRISELDKASALAGTELVPVVQDGVTKRTTTGAIGALLYPKHNTVTQADAGLLMMAEAIPGLPFPVDPEDPAQLVVYFQGIECKARPCNPIDPIAGAKGEYTLELPLITEPTYSRIRLEINAPIDGDSWYITDTDAANTLTITYTDTPGTYNVAITARTAQQLAEDTWAIINAFAWGENVAYAGDYSWLEFDLNLGGTAGYFHNKNIGSTAPGRIDPSYADSGNVGTTIFNIADGIKVKANIAAPNAEAIVVFTQGGSVIAMLRFDDLFLAANGNPHGTPGTTAYFSDILFYPSALAFSAGMRWAMQQCTSTGLEPGYTGHFSQRFNDTGNIGTGSNGLVEFEDLEIPLQIQSSSFSVGTEITGWDATTSVVVTPEIHIPFLMPYSMLGALIGVDDDTAIINANEIQRIKISDDALTAVPYFWDAILANSAPEYLLFSLTGVYGLLIPWYNGTLIDLGGLQAYFAGDPRQQQIVQTIMLYAVLTGNVYAALEVAVPGQLAACRRVSSLFSLLQIFGGFEM